MLFLWAFCNSSAIAVAPPVPDWQKCFGGSGVDIPNKIIHSTDGGYIVAGSTSSSNFDITMNHGARDIWVIKTDSIGSIVWQKTFGGSSNDFASTILEMSNGDIVVAGYTSSNNGNVSGNHGNIDEWLLRIGPSGNLIWQKTFGGSSADICNSMALCADGGFILGGSSSSTNGDASGNHGDKDFWIVKTDSAGNLQWQQSLGGSGTDECYAIRTTHDGGYIASGLTNSNDSQVSGNQGAFDFWVVKLDAAGSITWQRCLGGSSNEVSTTALENSAGEIMVSGYTNSGDGDVLDNHGSSDYWLVWLDSANGNMLSQHTYGGTNSDIAYDLIPTIDGGYMLAGGSFSSNFDVTSSHGGEDFWFVKTDVSGNIVWERTYGGTGNDRPVSILETGDQEFSAIGYTYSNNNDVSGLHGNSDIWFLKLSCLAPSANFLMPDSVCVNTLVNFTNASIHSAQYEWKVNDGLFSNRTNSNFQFTSSGRYKVSLVSSTCYSNDSISRFITIIDYPVPSITSSDPYLCEGNSATLSASLADSYYWSTGQAGQAVSVDSGGTYAVTVTKNGCSATTFYSIPEYSNPVVTLCGDTTICSVFSIDLSAPSGYQSYAWQNGSTDSVFHVTTDGIYSITVNDGRCSSTASIHVGTMICPVVTANFEATQTSVCRNSCIDFTNLSENSTSWEWSFPNAETTGSTDQSPTGICYNTPGTYPVYLVVHGAYNMSTAIMQQNYIIVNDFPSKPTIFPNGTFLTSTNAATYQWFLNSTVIDGANSRTLSADEPGYYSVLVSNTSGCSALSDSVYIAITGIGKPEDLNKLTVFPNPSTGMFTISINDRLTKTAHLTVSDLTGKILIETLVEGSNGKLKETVNLENFSEGVYMLQVRTDSYTINKKLVIEK